MQTGYHHPLVSVEGAPQLEESGPPEGAEKQRGEIRQNRARLRRLEKGRQRAHSKITDQHIQHPFQLVFTDLIGHFTPEVLGGYKYVFKVSGEHTRWTEVHLLKSKDVACIIDGDSLWGSRLAVEGGERIEFHRQRLQGLLHPNGNIAGLCQHQHAAANRLIGASPRDARGHDRVRAC